MRGTPKEGLLSSAQVALRVGGEGSTVDVATALSSIAHRLFGKEARIDSLRQLSGGATQELWSFDILTTGKFVPVILRRNAPDSDNSSALADMATEARLIRLAQSAGVPVPELIETLSPEAGLGAGYLMARVAGETLARKILRDAAFATARPILARQLGSAAARIHALDATAARPLWEGGVESELERVKRLYAACGQHRPVMQWALAWLADHRPPEVKRLSVVHGDLRNGNIVVGSEGLRAILDWELAHLGDPMEDLGWLCVTSWRFGNIDLPVGGFGIREELFEGYEEGGGAQVDPDRVRFHEVLGVLRWGLFCLHMSHSTSAACLSVERAAIGRRASETETDLLAMLAPLTGMRHA